MRLLVGRTLQSGAPSKPMPAQRTPRERLWLPAPGTRPSNFDAVIRRRVEAAHLIPEAPDTDYKRYRGSGGWGRRKRLNSIVADDTMLAHSSLEYDHLRDRELDGNNLWFLEQPLKLQYPVGNRHRVYTPDVLIIYPTHVECVEVKYESQAADPEAEAKWRCIADCLLGMGIGFRIVTELHIRREPRFANVKQVFTHRHGRIEASDVKAIATVLIKDGPQPAGGLASRFGIKLEDIWTLARRACVSLDLDAAPLSESTDVSARAPLLRPWS